MSLNRLFLVLLSLVGTDIASAQVEFGGFARSYIGIGSTTPSELRVARSTLRLEPDLRLPSIRLYGSFQVDENRMRLAPDARFTIREAYADARYGAFDIRLGRFLQTFGRSDGVILSDVFSSYDLSEFLTQDPSDLKRAVDGVRLSAQSGAHTVQVMISPFKPVSSLPDGEWSVADEAVNGIPVVTRSRGNRALDAGPLRAAMLVSLRPNLDWDVDLAFGHWSYPVDSYAKTVRFGTFGMFRFPTQVTLENRTSNSLVAIASTEYRATPILGLTAEATYWQHRETDILPTNLADLEAENPNFFLRTAPFMQGLFGVKSVWMGVNASAQVFVEHFIREPEFMISEPTVWGGSLSLFRRFWYDDLTLRLFTRFQHEPSGFWVNPEALYRVRETVQLRAGGHLFGGPAKPANQPAFSFSQYRPNSFFYSKLIVFW